MAESKPTRPCELCGKPFTPKPRTQGRFCSSYCSRKYGNRRKPAIDRFCRFVSPQPDGCWHWTGAQLPRGYGVFGVGRNDIQLAHRWAYDYFIGPIPDGLELDHLCRTTHCCNPLHLEAVSPTENRHRTRQFACKYGHPLDDANIRWQWNRTTQKWTRQCRACNHNRAVNRWAAIKRARNCSGTTP